jgi:hypothetical protein
MPIRIHGQSSDYEPSIQGIGDIDEVRVKGIGVVWKGVEIIDDFEDGSATNWTVPSSTGSDTIVGGLDGTDHAWRLNGFREGHLRGTDAVDRGAQPGDTFEYLFQIDSFGSGDALFRYMFAASGVNDGNCYYMEYEMNSSDPDVAIYKESGGNVQTTSEFKALNPRPSDTVRAVVRWNYGNARIDVDHYLNGNHVHTLSITDSEYTQPGTALFVNANLVVTIDELKITDST